MKRTAFLAVLAMAGACVNVATAAVTTFEDKSLSPETYENGANLSGSFSSGWASFNNTYDSDFGSWSGFAYSNTTNTTLMDYANQSSSVTGGGADGSATYAVGYYSSGYSPDPTITFSGLVTVTSIDITNTALTSLAMQNSLYGSKIFGTDGDPDYLLLTIAGYAAGESTGMVNFYLADFGTELGIVDIWKTVDLTSLGDVDKLTFSMTSSDVGEFGINTPTYFAIDNLQFVPEPSTAMFALLGLMPLLRRKR